MEVAARPSFDQLVESLDLQQQRLCAASAAMLETISYLDRAEKWGDDETSLSCFLSSRYGVSAGTAREWVRVARKLRELPAIAEAYSAGRVSWDQLRPLTRFAVPETDEEWALRVPGMRVGGLWLEARRHERDRKQREMQSDRQVRHLNLEWDEEKRVLHVAGDLPGEQGAAFEAALERRAEEVALETDPPPFDKNAARLADALVELVTAQGQQSTPATLVVHADAEVLTGTAGSKASGIAETGSGVQLSDETLRRIACDARVEWVAESNGRTVGIGRQGRAVPGWLGRMLRHRDRECRFPGCDRKRWIDAHHIVHWADGGPTDLANLVLLCGTHHRLIHEGGWRISGHPEVDLRFHDPGPRSRPRSRAPGWAAAAALA